MAPRTVQLLAALAASVLVAAGMLAFARPGQQQAGARAPVRAGLELIPPTADFVFLIDSGTQLRESGLGDLALGLLETDASLADARRAWPEAARRLNYTPDEMYARLLGKRVLLAAEGSDAPAEPAQQQQAAPARDDRAWVMVCEIDPDTDARLRERLRAAPRGLQHGHQVLSLESGRYELSTSRPAPQRKGLDADPILLIVGPTGQSALFDAALEHIARARAAAAGKEWHSKVVPATLASTEAGRRAAAGQQADICMLIRPRRTGPDAGAGRANQPPQEPWSDFVLLTGSAAAKQKGAAPADWVFRLAVRDSARRAEFARVPEMSDAPFLQMVRSGAAAAILQNSSSQAAGAAPGGPGQQVPAEAEGLISSDLPSRAAGALGALLLDLGLDPETQSRLTGRQALMIRPVDVPENAPARPILPAFTFAFETTDAANLAKLLDSRVAAMANRLELKLGGGKTPPRDFAGIRPAAVRTLFLESPSSNPLSVLIGQGPGPGGPSVCWSYPPNPRIIDGGKPLGWWVVTAVPGVPGQASLPVDPAASHRLAATALTPELGVEGESMKRWMSLGRLERRPLEPALPLLLPDNAPIRRIVFRIDSIEWRTWLAGESDLHGEFSLALASRPAPPALPAAQPVATPVKTP